MDNPEPHRVPAVPASGAPHALETLFVPSENPHRVNYREANPPFEIVRATLFAERPDGRAIIIYLRGQNVVVDAAAQRGSGEFGGYWVSSPPAT